MTAYVQAVARLCSRCGGFFYRLDRAGICPLCQHEQANGRPYYDLNMPVQQPGDAAQILAAVRWGLMPKEAA